MTNPERTSVVSSSPTSEKPVRPSDVGLAAILLRRYRDFIQLNVKADDLEMHPYVPEIESAIASMEALDASAPASGEDEVARLDFVEYYDGPIFEPRPSGEWVKYADHASTMRERDRTIDRLTAQVAELRAEIARLLQAVVAAGQYIDWQAFGGCRKYSAEIIPTSSEAIASIDSALAQSISAQVPEGEK